MEKSDVLRCKRHPKKGKKLLVLVETTVNILFRRLAKKDKIRFFQLNPVELYAGIALPGKK